MYVYGRIYIYTSYIMHMYVCVVNACLYERVCVRRTLCVCVCIV